MAEQLRQGTGIQRVIKADAPTERADGTPLSASEISHYNWYMDIDGGGFNIIGAAQLVNGEFSDTLQVDDVSPGVYDMYYTTVDTQGLESSPSQHLIIEVLPAFLAAPNPPTNVS